VSNDAARRPQSRKSVSNALSGIALAEEYTALANISPTTMRSRIDVAACPCAKIVVATARQRAVEAPPTVAVAYTTTLEARTEFGHCWHSTSMARLVCNAVEQKAASVGGADPLMQARHEFPHSRAHLVTTLRHLLTPGQPVAIRYM
jgi:hypothetical protein